MVLVYFPSSKAFVGWPHTSIQIRTWRSADSRSGDGAVGAQLLDIHIIYLVVEKGVSDVLWIDLRARSSEKPTRVVSSARYEALSEVWEWFQTKRRVARGPAWSFLGRATKLIGTNQNSLGPKMGQ